MPNSYALRIFGSKDSKEVNIPGGFSTLLSGHPKPISISGTNESTVWKAKQIHTGVFAGKFYKYADSDSIAILKKDEWEDAEKLLGADELEKISESLVVMWPDKKLVIFGGRKGFASFIQHCNELIKVMHAESEESRALVDTLESEELTIHTEPAEWATRNSGELKRMTYKIPSMNLANFLGTDTPSKLTLKKGLYVSISIFCDEKGKPVDSETNEELVNLCHAIADDEKAVVKGGLIRKQERILKLSETSKEYEIKETISETLEELVGIGVDLISEYGEVLKTGNHG